MKRLLLLLACLFTVLPLSAQLRFGAVGGVSFCGATDVPAKDVTRYHAGFVMQYRTSWGLGVQPSLIYHCKDARAESLRTGYLELPVGLQWGPDLILFRPYLEVAPMIGVALDSRIPEEMLERFEYGIGVGGGLELWHIQISARYNWNLNKFGKEGGAFRYTTLSLAFMF